MSEPIPKHVRAYLWEHYGGRCFYCRRPLKRHEVTVDHWIPQAAGGTSGRRNLRPACTDCNGAKADLLPQFFRPRRVHAEADRVAVRNHLLAAIAARGRAKA